MRRDELLECRPVEGTTMPEATAVHAGDAVDATLTFTLAAGEEASRITLLLTRTQAQSEHSAMGRARCIVLESSSDAAWTPATTIRPADMGDAPRKRFQAALRGLVPASICGGTYTPVFCFFAYANGRPSTGFEIDADQRFTVRVADDSASVDAGPAIVEIA
jgi:hypothetical protein